MATIIDTLLVQIEGDARGIQSTLKKVLDTAKGTVGDINKQEVDWTSIFSRSVTPAIISGVASMFAFAISQGVQFQQALLNTGTAAGESSAQIAQMSQSALQLSTTVPSSAQDIANAMAQVSAVFSNVNDQQQIVGAMAQLAASGFGNLNDIVSASLDLFKQWGVTTTSEAIDVLTSLMHGAQGAKESIPELAAQFSSISPALVIAGSTLKDFNGILSTFSATIKDIGADQAKEMFQSIADGASNASSPIAIFGGGVDAIRKSLRDNGGLETITKLSNVMSTQFGDNVGLIAKAFGLSAVNVEGFVNAGKKLPTLTADAKAVAGSAMTISGAYDQSSGSLRNLEVLWNHFKAEFTNIGSLFTPLINGFAGVVDSWLTQEDKFWGQWKKGFDQNMSALQAGLGVVSDFFTGGASGKLNSTLQGTGVGFSNDVLSRIDKSAEQSGLTQSLIDALGTGIKQGQYSQLTNTFNLTVPSGSQGLTAKMIAAQLYAQFNGQQ